MQVLFMNFALCCNNSLEEMGIKNTISIALEIYTFSGTYFNFLYRIFSDRIQLNVSRKFSCYM